MTWELYRGCTNYQGGCRYQERSYKRTPKGKEKNINDLTNEAESFKYKLIEEPFCHICGNPNVQTQDCTWHRNLYGFNRIHVMGKYFHSSIVAHDLLSKHILKLKNEEEYARPLGEALAFFVKQFHQELLRYNLIERLMGEIAKRIKNKWMHWSATGLENLLNILLVRYCNKERYNKLKQKYLNHKHTFIHVKVT